MTLNYYGAIQTRQYGICNIINCTIHKIIGIWHINSISHITVVKKAKSQSTVQLKVSVKKNKLTAHSPSTVTILPPCTISDEVSPEIRDVSVLVYQCSYTLLIYYRSDRYVASFPDYPPDPPKEGSLGMRLQGRAPLYMMPTNLMNL